MTLKAILILKPLILIIVFFLQDSSIIFLDENGVTLKCSPSANIGQTYVFKGTTENLWVL